MKVEGSIRQWKLLGLACQEFVMSIEVLTAVLLTFQALLVRDIVSLGECFPDISKDCCAFLLESSSTRKILAGLSTLDDEGRMILQNVGNQSPNNVASHPRKL